MIVRRPTRIWLLLLILLSPYFGAPAIALAVQYSGAQLYKLVPPSGFTTFGYGLPGHLAEAGQMTAGGPAANHQHALLWDSSGTAIDLNASGSPFTDAAVYATNGVNQVGIGWGDSTGGKHHAVLWSGTSASAVDLHPANLSGFTESFLVDVSGSVDGRFDFEQNAATSFLQHTLRVGFDKAFIVGFNSHSQMAQDYTDNVQLLSAGVHKLHDGGGTALYDAVYRACKEKFLKDRPDHPVRKAIVIVSDGEDNQSEFSKAQAIEMAQRSEVIIYAISTDDSGLVMRGDKVLEQLAEATGGRAFFPFKMKDITHSFAAIEDELRSQYVVSYKPANFDADGRYRSIEISTLKKDLQVRARKGYFAPQQ